MDSCPSEQGRISGNATKAVALGSNGRWVKNLGSYYTSTKMIHLKFIIIYV